MDLYTTSFSYPRPTPRSSSSPHAASSLNLPGSGSITSIPLPNVTTSTATQRKSTSAAPSSNAAQAERDWEAVQKLVLDVTSREGCLVTVTRESIDSPAHGASSDEGASGGETIVWNFHLSGGYQSVMAARGAVLRELPRDNRTVLKVARTDMLESPLAPTSALKADVQRRLDDIAADSKAFIAVVNPDNAGANAANVVAGAVLGTADGRGSEHLRQPDVSSPAQVNGDPTPATTEDGSTAGVDDNTVSTAETTESSQVKTPEPQLTGDGSGSRPGAAPTSTQVTYGLETERLCDLVITGGIESVEIAKVRLLVMLDELVRLAMFAICMIAEAVMNVLLMPRADCTPRYATSTISCKTSLRRANDPSFSRYKKRPRRTFTSQRPLWASSTHLNPAPTRPGTAVSVWVPSVFSPPATWACSRCTAMAWAWAARAGVWEWEG